MKGLGVVVFESVWPRSRFGSARRFSVSGLGLGNAAFRTTLHDYDLRELPSRERINSLRILQNLSTLRFSYGRHPHSH